MYTKEIKSTATVAWGPASSQSTYIATGTLAGAMDASFSTNAELEIWDVNLAEKSAGSGLVKVGSTPSNSRFNRVAWSPLTKHDQDGVIIGGMEDGSIGFWRASQIINKASSQECLLERKEAHKGAVRGLEVNPFQPYLVASGSIDAHILLWDLNNLSESFTPAQNKSNRLEDITDISWNCQVPHIMASASSNGYTVIWDLKHRKEVIQLGMPGGRKSVSAIAWNPDNATHILTATDDDSTPVIYSWDLRNAHAPNLTLTGHTKGILSLSWCPKDSELLLSSGKDNKILCWNPKTGTLSSEVSHSSNWVFDTKWCPRNPDIFSSASFDGKVTINSFQALSTGNFGATAAATTLATSPEDFFNATNARAPQSVEKTTSGVRQIPKWLKRPIGATFGFGGRLVSFSDSNPKRITITPISKVDLPSYARESLVLDSALSQNRFSDFSLSKIGHSIASLHDKDPQAVFWNTVKALVSEDPQKNLMNLLGFDREQFDKQVKALGLRPTLQSAVESEVPSGQVSPINFGTSNEDQAAFVFEQLSLSAQTTLVAEVPAKLFSGPFHLFGDGNETDRLITQAVILGDFSAAVDICIEANRLSDALLVSLCGGPELVTKTQELYLSRVQHPYLRIVSAILKKDLTDLVKNIDLKDWEHVLGIICAFAAPQDFGGLCGVLGKRFEEATATNQTLAMPAVICHMASGNSKKAANIILRLEEQSLPCHKVFSYQAYATWLEGLIEKIRGVERAASTFASEAQTPIQEAVPGLSEKYLAYSILMADQGFLEISTRYFNSLGSVEGEVEKVFGDRLANSVKAWNITIQKAQSPPFASVSVVPEASKQQPQMPQQQPSFAAPSQPSFNQPSSFAQHPAAQQSQQQHAWSQPAPFAAPQSMASAAPSTPSFTAPSTSTAFGWNPPAAPAQPIAPPAPGQQMFSQPPTPAQPSPFALGSGFQAPGPYAQHSPTELAGQHPHRAPTFVPQAPPPPPAAPSIPQPGVSFVGGAFSASRSGSVSSMPPTQTSTTFNPPVSPTGPTPIIPTTPGIISPAAPVAPQKPVGGFNDAPVIAPRQPLSNMPLASPITQPILHPMAPQGPAAVSPQSSLPQPSSSIAPALQPQVTQPQAGPTSPRLSNAGPVDPSKIPPESMPIYQTFTGLISFCQQRAMPVQRRVVEDSVKRLQFLFHQLANNELSSTVFNDIQRMCSLIGQRNFDAALELHVPLMTGHFTEVGQWILAIKRLIEVAKTCPQ